MAIHIEQLPALTDNFNYLLVESSKGEAIAIDPSGENPIHNWLLGNSLRLIAIWNTHHHHDHTGGNLALKSHYGVPILGPYNEKIPGKSEPLQGHESFEIWGTPVQVLSTPGHTLGHIAYYLPELEALFSGDVLFSAGCGRLFEGTPSQAFESLTLLSGLPLHTLIYGAHEYSKVNTEFALQYEPGNPNLQDRYQQVLTLRHSNLPTVPTSIAEEKSFNPFLRTQSQEIRSHLGLSQTASDLLVFTRLRELRNEF